ncbi:hypothetical protein Tco_0583246 [Tanacetum coccineum]
MKLLNMSSLVLGLIWIRDIDFESTSMKNDIKGLEREENEEWKARSLIDVLDDPLAAAVEEKKKRGHVLSYLTME